MRRISLTAMLLASTITQGAANAQTDAAEQQPPPQTRQDGGRRANPDDEEEIVVTGQRLPGSVIGDVQPELMLNPGDVRALGVSDVTELVAELGPQLTSGSGGQPLVLLEGRRVSSFREIATIPTEAIARVEILPEEVAIKYGYAPDQKVMNIVLRRRFRAFTLEAQDRFTTDGGANHAEGEMGFLALRRGSRINLNIDYQHDAALKEIERGILTTTGGDTQRTLQPSAREYTVTGTYARPLSQSINASINGELSTTQNASLVGPPLSNGAVVLPGIVIPDFSALDRSVSAQNVRLGSTINRDGRFWRGTLTTTYTHDESRTITERGYDLANSTDSLVAPGLAVVRPADVARSRADVATADLTVNGSLYKLPAGDLSLSARIGGTASGFESETTRSLAYTATSLNRSIGLGSVSLDVPLLKSPSPFIGKLSLNGNVELQSLSDFGTIRAYGGGVNWRPRSGVAFIASYRGSQTAPTVQQLGNPTIETSNVQVFDYQKGTTVNITQISGGNRGLREADQDDIRLGLTLKPWTKPDITLTLDYNNRKTRNAIGALPGTTDAAELAFGDRFKRSTTDIVLPDGSIQPAGTLLSIDTRSINIAERDSSSFRWGINFTRSLKTPQSQIDAIRKSFQQRFPNGFPQGGPGGGEGGRPEGGGPRPEGEGNRAAGGSGFGGPPGGGPGGGGPGGGGPGGGGGGFGGGGRGGGGGGRINFAVYHTIHLTDTVRLRDGLPQIDLLNGGTLGEQAGQPRHEVELQAGFSQSGMGMRLNGKWQSATRVTGTGTASSDLRFSDIATFNLRLFANLGQLPGLIGKPLWRGARLQLGVNNILNTRQRVTDGTGATPLAYRPGLVDPLGRTITITLRKQLF